jgi:hypothetical protein
MATGILLDHRQTHGQSLTWDLKFTKRNRKLYPAENTKPFKPEQDADGSSENDRSDKIKMFFSQQTHGLLPRDYSYNALQQFLSDANLAVLDGEQNLDPKSKDAEKTVLLDQRMDPSCLNSFTSRHWQGYHEYPPKGEAIFTGVLSARGLCDKLNETVSM